jgi:hypothetical protein
MAAASPDDLTALAFQDILSEKEKELLSPKEIEIERKAKLEELKKRSWMNQSAQQLAGRIPVSVFAMSTITAAE